MNTTAKITIFPQPTKKGFPLKITIIQNRKPIVIGLKYYLTEYQRSIFWSESKKELRKKYPFYNEVQAELERVKNEYGLNTNEKPKLIVNANKSFTQYFKNYLIELEAKKQFGLLQKAKTTYSHFEKYCSVELGKTDLPFNELNIDFLKGLQLYLISKENISAVSQKGYFEKLRSIINLAIEEGNYNPIRHPFSGFKFLPSNVKPKCLNREQFDYLKDFDGKLRTSKNPDDKKLLNTYLKFTFQYYAFGMRVSDLLLLKWSNIYEHGKRLKYTMFKTKQTMDIVLNNRLLNILYCFANEVSLTELQKKYFQYKQENHNEYFEHIRKRLNKLATDEETKHKRIFSSIPDFKTSEIKELYNKIQSSTTLYNRSLKKLSNKLNEKSTHNFHLASHMARHTFAYISLLNKEDVYYISKALNHKSIKTTEVYLRGFDDRKLDNVLYKKGPTQHEKNEVDSMLKEFISTADFEKKKKLMDLLNML